MQVYFILLFTWQCKTGMSCHFIYREKSKGVFKTNVKRFLLQIGLSKAAEKVAGCSISLCASIFFNNARLFACVFTVGESKSK